MKPESWYSAERGEVIRATDKKHQSKRRKAAFRFSTLVHQSKSKHADICTDGSKTGMFNIDVTNSRNRGRITMLDAK
jgi:hypothetical protein